LVLVLALTNSTSWKSNSPNFFHMGFWEDEMRRPTPCAVPFGSANVRRALAAQRGGSAHHGW
jgi:hypothetical protein